MRRNPAQTGFADAFVVGGGNARLERIDALLDWSALETEVGVERKEEIGRPAYATRTMLKVLLLQVWYGLSDPMMEDALSDRLSFRRFVGLGLDQAVPDHSTISRFRTALLAAHRWEGLLAQVNAQLDARGVILRQGTLIDATLIDAAAAEPPKQKGGGRSAADPDAAWTKRPNGQARFGYKLHMAVDRGSQLIRGLVLTPANINEITVAPQLVQGDEAAVWADKGYVGPTLREMLAEHGIRNRVQRRASRSRQLTPRERLRNKLIGRVRGRIEGVFGALKRSYGLARMKYMGLARNALAMGMAAIAWNLARVADQSR
jgi:transposase, IS5 family